MFQFSMVEAKINIQKKNLIRFKHWEKFEKFCKVDMNVTIIGNTYLEHYIFMKSIEINNRNDQIKKWNWQAWKLIKKISENQ